MQKQIKAYSAKEIIDNTGAYKTFDIFHDIFYLKSDVDEHYRLKTEPVKLDIKIVNGRLQVPFRVLPKYLKNGTFVKDSVVMKITNPEELRRKKILGKTGYLMAENNFLFEFTKNDAEHLINKGYAVLMTDGCRLTDKAMEDDTFDPSELCRGDCFDPDECPHHYYKEKGEKS